MNPLLPRYCLPLYLSVALFSVPAYSQTVIGGDTIDASAMLDVQSIDKGVLLPRMTTAQRNAIPNPAFGLLVLNTTLQCVEINLGSAIAPEWKCLSTGQGMLNLSALDTVYWNRKLNGRDTLGLSARIDARLSTGDTASMLSPYLKKVDAVNPKNTSGIDGIYSWEYPEGLSTDIVNFQSNVPYTVPNGKNLYITSSYYYPLVNGVAYGTDGSNLIFPEGTVIQGCEGCENNISYGFTGFLVNKTGKIIPIILPLNDVELSYTVPPGKILVLLSGTGQAAPLCVESSLYQNYKNIWLFQERTTIKHCNSTKLNPPRTAYGFTGYLIDK